MMRVLVVTAVLCFWGTLGFSADNCLAGDAACAAGELLEVDEGVFLQGRVRTDIADASLGAEVHEAEEESIVPMDLRKEILKVSWVERTRRLPERRIRHKGRGIAGLQKTGSAGCNIMNFLTQALPSESNALFSLPDSFPLDLVEFLADQMNKTSEFGDTASILIPQVVPEDDGSDDYEDVATIGEAAGVAACGYMDYLGGGSVLAFGYEKSVSICAAINPCTHSYALAQVDLLPNIKVGPYLTVSIDSMGFSLSRAFQSTTYNKMWNNLGPAAEMTVDGHFVLKGTGRIGMSLSDKVKCTIDVAVTLLVDADPKGDGVVQVVTAENSSPSPADLAILLSGRATPSFEITTEHKGGDKETFTLDFANLFALEADIYFKMQDNSAQLLVAVSVSIQMSGLCDLSPWTSIFCMVFAPESQITFAFRAYVDGSGLGIQLAIEGSLSLGAGGLVEDILNWDADADITLSMGFKGNAFYMCASSNGNEFCFHKCGGDNDCEDNEFCDDFLEIAPPCRTKKSNGHICHKNSVCQSGYCVAGFCSECPSIDTQTGCPSNKFCTQTVAAGYRCTEKRDLGGACLSPVACKSDICAGGFCSECPTLDSLNGCPSGEFCAQTLAFGYRCETRRSLSSACLSGNACASGYCVGGFCSQCPTIDSSTGCSSSQFCTQTGAVGYRCVTKRDKGGLCLSGNVCKSGRCSAGFCVDCTAQSHCSSSKYCDWGGCHNKLSDDTWCTKSYMCSSGNCGLTWTGVKCNRRRRR